MTHSDFYIKCRICGGKKTYPVKEKIGMYNEIEHQKVCEYCGGKGYILKSKVDRSLRKVVERNRRGL